MLMACCLIQLLGCTKDVPVLHVGVVPKSISALELSVDSNFVDLNNVLDRFDPKYLQLVYNDKRTIEELNLEANIKLEHFSKNPSSIKYQREISSFYNFNSFEEFMVFSKLLLSSRRALVDHFYSQKRILSPADTRKFFIARKLYAETKIKEVSGDREQKKANGIGQDYVEANLSSFDYYEQIVNESIEELDGSGGSIKCNDACCFEYFSCKNTAKNVYLEKLLQYSIPTAIVFGRAGFVFGTSYPVLGNVIGGVSGIISGGLAGALVANDYYQREINGCIIKFNECVFLRDNKK